MLVRLLERPSQRRVLGWAIASQAMGQWPAPLAIVSASGAQWSLAPYPPALASCASAGVRLAEVDAVSVVSGWNGTPPLQRIVPLPGFTVVRSTRTGTYRVVRYRALLGSGTPEPMRVLKGLFPNAGYPLVLLERPN